MYFGVQVDQFWDLGGDFGDHMDHFWSIFLSFLDHFGTIFAKTEKIGAFLHAGCSGCLLGRFWTDF